MPLLMLLFPKERYGQFGSATYATVAITQIVMVFLAGVFMDWLKGVYTNSDGVTNEDYYRWMYIWSASFQAISMFFFYRTYRFWKKYGGKDNYVAPAVGLKDGSAETLAAVKKFE